jgi:hypothetical protein
MARDHAGNCISLIPAASRSRVEDHALEAAGQRGGEQLAEPPSVFSLEQATTRTSPLHLAGDVIIQLSPVAQRGDRAPRPGRRARPGACRAASGRCGLGACTVATPSARAW